MKKIFKNPIENADGSVNCIEIHPAYGEIPHTQDPALEYEISKDLGPDDWAEIKLCPKTEKDADSEKRLRERFKLDRAQAMNSLEVTTSKGNVFDADETSQTRMSRAITIMDDTETTVWVLANNTPIQATKAELKEALRLAGEAQAALWVQS